MNAIRPIPGSFAALAVLLLSFPHSNAQARFVINEVDYDQPGTDTTEFVEIYNADTTTASLNGVTLVFVNGNSSLEYFRVDLSGNEMAAQGFLVVGNAELTVPVGVTKIEIPDATIQNGAPDGLALVDNYTSTVLDALSYEGAITAAVLTDYPFGTVNLVEGSMLATPSKDDGNVTTASLNRCPNGADSNDADNDWSLYSTPTPGAANDSGGGPCTLDVPIAVSRFRID